MISRFQLSRKKNELPEIYKTIYDTRGFSEDCEKSPIHRLISTLLTHIVQNVDSEKALLAAKCLGELGPNDLGSIALKFDNQTQTYRIVWIVLLFHMNNLSLFSHFIFFFWYFLF